MILTSVSCGGLIGEEKIKSINRLGVHSTFSFTIDDGERPMVPSPRNSANADLKSPVESPFKYKIGSRDSTFGDFR
jgi:hypothetical protein